MYPSPLTGPPDQPVPHAKCSGGQIPAQIHGAGRYEAESAAAAAPVA